MLMPESQSIWYNELGSKMALDADGKGGLTGTYVSAVGSAQDEYALVGRYNPAQSPPTVGWTVQWVNSHKKTNSVTSWSGQLMNVDGVPTILTTWLLTQQTKPENEWESTMVDQDVFTPNKPTDEQIRLAKMKRGCSNPV
ncbi:hypothetical protein C5F50_05920 [Nitrosopumilus ureiphilus]|uniref:Uncharacterized protein n=2 Tax=Nitrosopumilus ureiphilus TaxID=1470067 RepID=A0A7D5RB25_9ARCH|nr:hypothetical protein C5F50_05920 [Nitrosopumilus ureiphilus]